MIRESYALVADIGWCHVLRGKDRLDVALLVATRPHRNTVAATMRAADIIAGHRKGRIVATARPKGAAR